MQIVSLSEGRILITRDRCLLKRGEVTHGYYIRAGQPYEQLIEVMRRYNLTHLAAPFKLCIRCNGMLEGVPKERILDQLPPRVKKITILNFVTAEAADRSTGRGATTNACAALSSRCLKK